MCNSSKTTITNCSATPLFTGPVKRVWLGQPYPYSLDSYIQGIEAFFLWWTIVSKPAWGIAIQWNLWIKDTLGPVLLKSVLSLDVNNGKGVQTCVLYWEVVPFSENCSYCMFTLIANWAKRSSFLYSCPPHLLTSSPQLIGKKREREL